MLKQKKKSCGALWACLMLTGLGLAPAAHAVSLYATDGTNLVRFDSTAPGSVSPVSITGLTAGDTLVGLDARPSNGAVYALSNTGRIYTLNVTTGAATLVSTVAVALSGTDFGVDFNPVPDRLRVVSDTRQNLRINVDTGATTVDSTIQPGTPTVTGAAYTNNVAGATSTTLYDIDAAAGTLVIQAPPNNGTLTNAVPLGLGTNLNPNIGFDIAGVSNTAYASIATGGVLRLYTIDLGTGARTSLGTIGNGTILYKGLTVAVGTDPTGAAGLVVTTPADVSAADGVISLREAITTANSNADASIITFDATVFAAPQTINLTGVLPDLSSDITITGPAAGVTVRRDSGGNYRIFKVISGKTVSISKLTMSNGNATDPTDLGDRGGAIFNAGGTLTLTDCNLVSNTANFGGGLFNESGTATLTGGTMTGNSAGYGAGLFSQSETATATLTVTNATLSGNSAVTEGGAIYSRNSGGGTTLTVTGSTLSGNSAARGGGLLSDSGTATLTNSTVSGNSGGGVAVGGGIAGISHSTLSGNTGRSGLNVSGGSVTLSNSTITGNTGGIGSTGSDSGKKKVDPNVNLVARIETDTATPGGPGDGGGVNVSSGSVTIRNSTIAGNSGGAGGPAGTGPAGGNGGAGGLGVTGGTVNIGNTIVATNTGGTGVAAGSADIQGTVSSQGFNLIGNSTGAVGLVASDLKDAAAAPLNLGALANNGGPTQTIKLLAGSPAIDKGKDLAPTTPVDLSGKDQRGETRPKQQANYANATGGDGSDIGAYEEQTDLPEPPQSGPNFVVNVTNDNDGACTTLDCSLREAIAAANANTDASEITFDPTVFASAQTITLANGQLSLTTDITLTGPTTGGVTIDANTLSRILNKTGGTLNVSNLTFINGRANSSGEFGREQGGAFQNSSGDATISNCTFVGNHGSIGGAIFNKDSTTVTLKNCTFFNNDADGGRGGGALSTDGTLNIINCTLAGNHATGSSYGGSGLLNTGDVTIGNSLFANTGANITSFSDIYGAGTSTSNGFNLSSDATGPNNGTTDQINTDPKLGALANNGGPTQTIKLLAGSPALDKGKDLSGTGKDQRGQNRPFNDPNIAPATDGDNSDIGAYEEQTILDSTPPTADITDVTPDPRNISVSSISIVFSEAVTGFDLADLTLTRDGGANLLTGAQSLSSVDGGVSWTLGNLSGITGAAGAYTLTLTAAGSGIQDLTGNALVANASDNWTFAALGVSISGMVRNSAGGGVENVTVQAKNRTGTTVLASAVTDSAGNYTLPALPAGTYDIVAVPPAPRVTFAPALYNDQLITADRSDLNFTASFNVSGKVTTSSDAPLKGMVVALVSHLGQLLPGGTATRSTATAADGTYNFANVPPGVYIVAPRVSSGPYFVPSFTEVVVSPSSPVANFKGAVGSDTTSPAIDLTVTPTGTAPTLSRSAQGNVSDGASGVAGVLLRLRNNSTGQYYNWTTQSFNAAGAVYNPNVLETPATIVVNPTTGARTYALALPTPLPVGSYTVTATALDNAFRRATATANFTVAATVIAPVIRSEKPFADEEPSASQSRADEPSALADEPSAFADEPSE